MTKCWALLARIHLHFVSLILTQVWRMSFRDVIPFPIGLFQIFRLRSEYTYLPNYRGFILVSATPWEVAGACFG